MESTIERVKSIIKNDVMSCLLSEEKIIANRLLANLDSIEEPIERIDKDLKGNDIYWRTLLDRAIVNTNFYSYTKCLEKKEAAKILKKRQEDISEKSRELLELLTGLEKAEEIAGHFIEPWISFEELIEKSVKIARDNGDPVERYESWISKKISEIDSFDTKYMPSVSHITLAAIGLLAKTYISPISEDIALLKQPRLSSRWNIIILGLLKDLIREENMHQMPYGFTLNIHSPSVARFLQILITDTDPGQIPSIEDNIEKAIKKTKQWLEKEKKHEIERVRDNEKAKMKPYDKRKQEIARLIEEAEKYIENGKGNEANELFDTIKDKLSEQQKFLNQLN